MKINTVLSAKNWEIDSNNPKCPKSLKVPIIVNQMLAAQFLKISDNFAYS